MDNPRQGRPRPLGERLRGRQPSRRPIVSTQRTNGARGCGRMDRHRTRDLTGMAAPSTTAFGKAASGMIQDVDSPGKHFDARIQIFSSTRATPRDRGGGAPGRAGSCVTTPGRAPPLRPHPGPERTPGRLDRSGSGDHRGPAAGHDVRESPGSCADGPRRLAGQEETGPVRERGLVGAVADLSHALPNSKSDLLS